MILVAYVILPFGHGNPLGAIQASLAPFQHGGEDDLPDCYLAFIDETDRLRRVHEACCSFILDVGRSEWLEVRPRTLDTLTLDLERITAEMRRHDQRRWDVRFADFMDLDTFFDRFGALLKRDFVSGRYGRRLNPFGRWHHWDLGDCRDGWIAGSHDRRPEALTTRLSNVDSLGFQMLRDLEAALARKQDEVPIPIRTVNPDTSVELVSTLLSQSWPGEEPRNPSMVVLPPGSVGHALRWLDTRIAPSCRELFPWLGLPLDASPSAVIRAAWERFPDHWAAAVTYRA